MKAIDQCQMAHFIKQGKIVCNTNCNTDCELFDFCIKQYYHIPPADLIRENYRVQNI